MTVNKSLEEARYNLARNLTLLTTVLLISIGTLYFIQNDLNAYPILFGGVVALVSFILILNTKKYRVPSIISIILISAISALNLTIFSNFYHVVDVFWIVCVSISSFFILGKRWGISITIINFCILFVILNLIQTGTIIQLPKPFNAYSQINFFINLSIAGTIFTYLIHEFLKQNESVTLENINTNVELSSLNEEKTVMLKEIHHRVKNNLQIVTSLLRLQSNDMTDLTMKADFTLAIDRVLAIAKIHDKMYHNEQLSQINLNNYLTELIDDLIHTYSGHKKIGREVESNIHSIDPKNLVPLALIFNELVTNSLKHAFPNSQEGHIVIKALIDDENLVEITYTDNGQWKETITDPNRVSIGLSLIESFVDQLDAEMKVLKETQGTKYIISFRLN